MFISLLLEKIGIRWRFGGVEDMEVSREMKMGSKMEIWTEIEVRREWEIKMEKNQHINIL